MAEALLFWALIILVPALLLIGLCVFINGVNRKLIRDTDRMQDAIAAGDPRVFAYARGLGIRSSWERGVDMPSLVACQDFPGNAVRATRLQV